MTSPSSTGGTQVPDGFYSVNFTVPTLQGFREAGGVVVLFRGKIYGGDSSYSYQGNYSTDGKSLLASVYGSPFNDYLQSIFVGLDAQSRITLTGIFNQEGFVLQAMYQGLANAVSVRGKFISKIDHVDLTNTNRRGSPQPRTETPS